MPSIQYHERSSGHNSDNRLYRPFVVGCLIGLVVAGISGTVFMYGKLQGLEATVDGLKDKIDHVYRLVEPHYRGVPDGPNGPA